MIVRVALCKRSKGKTGCVCLLQVTEAVNKQEIKRCNKRASERTDERTQEQSCYQLRGSVFFFSVKQHKSKHLIWLIPGVNITVDWHLRLMRAARTHTFNTYLDTIELLFLWHICMGNVNCAVKADAFVFLSVVVGAFVQLLAFQSRETIELFWFWLWSRIPADWMFNFQSSFEFQNQHNRLGTAIKQILITPNREFLIKHCPGW